MKKVWASVIGGVLLVIVGLLWILQGSGAMGDSGGMNGKSQWALMGTVVGLVGLVLLAGAVRRLRTRKHQ